MTMTIPPTTTATMQFRLHDCAQNVHSVKYSIWFIQLHQFATTATQFVYCWSVFVYVRSLSLSCSLRLLLSQLRWSMYFQMGYASWFYFSSKNGQGKKSMTIASEKLLLTQNEDIFLGLVFDLRKNQNIDLNLNFSGKFKSFRFCLSVARWLFRGV